MHPQTIRITTRVRGLTAHYSVTVDRGRALCRASADLWLGRARLPFIQGRSLGGSEWLSASYPPPCPPMAAAASSRRRKKTMIIDVRPVMMTYEEFYCGFTTDSHPSFSCNPSESCKRSEP